MFNFFRAQEKQPGLTPGTLVYTGELASTDEAQLTYFAMGQSMQAPEATTLEKLAQLKPDRLWVNVSGDHDVDVIRGLGNLFKLHDLVLEDFLNPMQRPKLESYEEGLFLVVQEPYLLDNKELRSRQIGFFLSERVLITVHREGFDPFEPILVRIKRGGGRLASLGLDYLLYALFDMVIDRGFRVLASLEDELDEVEEETIDMCGPNDELQGRINRLKKQMILVRRTLVPLKEVCTALMDPSLTLILNPTRVFFRDVTDHVHQLVEFVEIFRERLNDNSELYHTRLAQHTNSIMQTLGTIGGIFIPITFIAGLYGMNFKSMPELSWDYGYPAALGLMGLTVVGLYLFFKKRRWL